MADCTDIAFRVIARSLGLEFAWTEMISAEALARQNRKTLPLLRREKNDSPIGAQLVGANPDSMAKSAAMIEEMGFDVLDINCGCPVPKITKLGAGSALLRNPDLVKKIFKSVIKNTRNIPVTLKTRIGWQDSSGKEALRLGQIAQDLGLAAITIHGRTRSQGYSGKADWKIISLLKSKLTIPVFGNGDIFSPQDAKKMFSETNCDAVVVGRGALGNPWIYRDIQNILDNKKVQTISFSEKKKILLKHLRLEIKYEGEKNGVLRTRKIATWYFKGLPNVSEFRNNINRAKTFEEMSRIIKTFIFPTHDLRDNTEKA